MTGKDPGVKDQLSAADTWLPERIIQEERHIYQDLYKIWEEKDYLQIVPVSILRYPVEQSV
jgi:hypothetical protein